MKPLRGLSAWKVVAALALSTLVANAVGYLAFTRPREERTRRAKELARELSVQLDTERSGVERLRRRAQSIEDNGRDVQRFLKETLTTQREGLAADLDGLEDVFRQSGVHVSRRAYSRQLLAGIAALQVEHNLSLTGGSEQVTSFLRQLETSPRFLVLSRLRLNQLPEGRTTVEATVVSFYRQAGEGSARTRAPARRPGA